MSKQSSHPRRHHRGSLWIAMLATLAFAGAGQALAPTPAAALHIDACAQPDSGLCDAADEGPTSGDSSSATSKGGGGPSGPPSAPPPPSAAPWDKRGSNSLPTQTTKAAADRYDKVARYRRHCGVISDRIVELVHRSDRAERWYVEVFTGPDFDRQHRLRINSEAMNELYGAFGWQMESLESQWERFNCEGLGFSDLGL